MGSVSISPCRRAELPPQSGGVPDPPSPAPQAMRRSVVALMGESEIRMTLKHRNERISDLGATLASY